MACACIVKATSNIATSRCWPLPVWLRRNKAEATEKAAVIPVAISTTLKPTRHGPVSGCPVSAIIPETAWIAPS